MIIKFGNSVTLLLVTGFQMNVVYDELCTKTCGYQWEKQYHNKVLLPLQDNTVNHPICDQQWIILLNNGQVMVHHTNETTPKGISVWLSVTCQKDINFLDKPNMLKILPISYSFQHFPKRLPIFVFYSHIITNDSHILLH